MPEQTAKRLSIAILGSLTALYVATSFFIGGDAFHGREADGHFYVAHHNGAQEHEVGRLTFLLSVWELRLLATCWLIAMVIAAFVYLRKLTK